MQTEQGELKKHGDLLVTGGTGFLGRPLVDYLVQQGRHVRVIGRRGVPAWCHNKSIEFVRGDITDSSIVEKALAGVGQIYHLAAAIEGDWATHKAVTVDASAHLLGRFAAQGGGRIVFVSSLMVYDSGMMTNGVIVDEDFPIDLNPERSSNYARAKTEAEYTARTYLTHPHVKLTIVRPAVIYGPGMKNPLNGVAFPFKRKLLAVLGRGNKRVPLIYIDDAVRGLVEIMNNENTVGHTYNLVDPQPPTQNDYLALYRELTGDKRPVIRIPSYISIPLLRLADYVIRLLRARKSLLAQRASRAAKRVQFTGERLQRDTGFVPSVGYQEGLLKMLRPDQHEC